GVLLLGLFINTYLYGLVTYQFIVYYNTKFNDPLWIKSVVGVLFCVDTLHSAIAVYAGWDTCVTHYGDASYFLTVSWTIPFTAVATAFVAIISQGFLGHRVYILTKSLPLVILIGILSLIGCIAGFYAGILSGVIKEVAHFDRLNVPVTFWLAFQTAADLLITASLITVLSRSRTGFHRTDTIINRLIRGAVQTGVFVSIFALADMFSFLLHRDTNLYAMFAYPIGRIYTNTLLDTLNARSSLKNVGHAIDVDSEANTNSFRMQNQSQTLASAPHTVHSIQVNKEVVTDVPDERSLDAKYTGAEDVYTHGGNAA
ncbi:hypothetical protein AMATHDRAFT_139073, partial [Amanita thiersii Skay4041]